MKIEIKENKAGGKVFSYHLMINRNGYQWWGTEIDNADQMRQIAKILVDKADEIECDERSK